MLQFLSRSSAIVDARCNPLVISALRLYRVGQLLADNIEFNSDSRRVCIAGHNGSGKTTLLLALAGLLPVSSGHISILGLSRAADRRRVCGVFSSAIEIPPYLSAAQVISQFGDKCSRLSQFEEEFLYGLDLESAVSALSEGQKRKIGIIGALRKEQGALLLDEPFSALDATSCGLLRGYLDGYAGLLVYVDHRSSLSGSREARISL